MRTYTILALERGQKAAATVGEPGRASVGRKIMANGDDIEWLRELEASTKNSLMKLNSKARTEAVKRSEADISVHKWATLTLPSRLYQETAAAAADENTPVRRRKRPLSSGSEVLTPIRSGTRLANGRTAPPHPSRDAV